MAASGSNGFFASCPTPCREESPGALITYVNHPPTEHLNLPFLDVVSHNVYLEREPDFRKYLARLQSLAGDRPVFLAELGLDAHGHGQEQQQRFLEWQLRAVFEKGLCGAAVYSWTDEWSIFSQDIEGWGFGLTDADRRPKPALETVQNIYTSDLYALRATKWPRVSVVVASYNGGRTLDECLQSLVNLTYPDYEVVVIDDGSADNTPEIVAQHDVRCIRTENGGLSCARNLGIEASTGEIVAFIDSDAYADPDWLFYIVTALREQDAAAVGGPNLAPPRMDSQPPASILPPAIPLTFCSTTSGPSMFRAAIWRSARTSCSGSVDSTTPIVRRATMSMSVGNYWSVMRRLPLAQGRLSGTIGGRRCGRICVSSADMVSRKAHLRRRYPGRFNIFGDLVWAGSIYDGMHSELRQQGLPSLFRSRVYQGRFGSAQFQSLYQPFQAWWFQVFTTAEWQLLSWFGALAAVLTLVFASLPFALIPLLIAVGMLLATVSAAAIPAVHAVRRQRSLKRHRWRAPLPHRGAAHTPTVRAGVRPRDRLLADAWLAVSCGRSACLR